MALSLTRTPLSGDDGVLPCETPEQVPRQLLKMGGSPIDVGTLVEQVQHEGAWGFVDSWTALLRCIQSKSRTPSGGQGT